MVNRLSFLSKKAPTHPCRSWSAIERESESGQLHVTDAPVATETHSKVGDSHVLVVFDSGEQLVVVVHFLFVSGINRVRQAVPDRSAGSLASAEGTDLLKNARWSL